MMLKDKIKALRENKGLTKKQLADEIGISERAYITYEYGQREPGLETVVKLAKFYNVTTDYLLDAEITEPPDPLDMLNLSPLEKAMFQMYINVSPKTRREMEEVARKAAAGADFQPIIDMLLSEPAPEMRQSTMVAVETAGEFRQRKETA